MGWDVAVEKFYIAKYFSVVISLAVTLFGREFRLAGREGKSRSN